MHHREMRPLEGGWRRGEVDWVGAHGTWRMACREPSPRARLRPLEGYLGTIAGGGGGTARRALMVLVQQISGGVGGAVPAGEWAVPCRGALRRACGLVT